MLDFQNISIQRKGKKVLDDFSLKAPDGVILALLGEDKEGKSTLLKAASGGEKPETGDIYIDGISIYEKGENAYCNFGYMSKEYGFYSLLKVEEYYELFLALYKVGGRYRSRRIEEVLELLDMKEYEGAFIGELPAETLPFLYYPEMMGFITDVLVMESGKNLTFGPVEEVYAEALCKSPVRMHILAQMEKALEVLKENPLVDRVTVDGDDVIFRFNGGEKEEAELLTDLVASGALIPVSIPIQSVNPTILFMFFNAESFQEGYSYDTSAYLYQFLIISTIQIGMIFVLMPFSVWGFYSTDREKHMLEEFVMIPGSSKQFIIARVSVIIAVYMMLFISSLPIISLSCIYSGLPWRKIIRLGIMLFICTFWSASVSIFSFSYCKKGIWAFAQNTVIEAVFILGTILGTEIMRTISISVSGMDNLAPITTSLCLLLSLINPLAAYMGYYGNITGDSGLMNLYCGRIGIDSSTQAFSFLFYKAASIMCIFMGIAFLALAVWQMEKQARE